METKNPKPEHVEDIHKYALELSKEIETAPDIVEWLNEQLSLEIWKKDDGAWKAEILITMGGPTVRLEIDSRYTYATLFHSWGWTDSRGETLERNISETATEILKDFIEDCCLN